MNGIKAGLIVSGLALGTFGFLTKLPALAICGLVFAMVGLVVDDQDWGSPFRECVGF